MSKRVVVVRGVGCGCIVAAHAADYPIDPEFAHEFFEHVRVDGFEIARVEGAVLLSEPCDKCQPPKPKKARP